MNRDLNQIIHKGECIDTNDPKKLGRIRAIDLAIHDGEQENGNSDEGKRTYVPWGSKDPFLYKPLLPWFTNVIPKGRDESNQRGEYVHLFYSNLDRMEGSNDRFYIGPVISSPVLSNFDPITSSEIDLDSGYDNKDSQPSLIKDDGSDKDEILGVYPPPNDVTLCGRGTADIVIKDNDVILRAGKSFPNENKQLPLKNNNRAFLQLSKFEFKTEKGNESKETEIKFKDLPIKKLVEYHVNNPENGFQKFSGSVKIYHLDIPEISTNNMSIDTPIPEGKKQIQTIIRFSNIELDKVSDLVNDIIKTMKAGPSIKNLLLNLDKYTTSSDINSTADVGNEDLLYNQDNFGASGALPLYYKPSDQMWETYLTSKPGEDNLSQTYFNISNLISKIKRPGDDTDSSLKGHGLIYSSNKNNRDIDLKTDIIVETTIDKYDNSVGILGGDVLYMISHNSKKPSTGQIDISDSLMGITENQAADELEKKTSSVVRGEELFEFLNMIVRFLGSHVHGYHQESPNEQGLAETITLTEINKALSEFKEKVLNKNIRIN